MKETDERILSKLTKEFDKPFFVAADTIDFDLLRDSAYLMLHRPHFAMKGCTHDIFQLNPHKKISIDAAPVDADVISFDEYLKMF